MDVEHEKRIIRMRIWLLSWILLMIVLTGMVSMQLDSAGRCADVSRAYLECVRSSAAQWRKTGVKHDGAPTSTAVLCRDGLEKYLKCRLEKYSSYSYYAFLSTQFAQFIEVIPLGRCAEWVPTPPHPPHPWPHKSLCSCVSHSNLISQADYDYIHLNKHVDPATPAPPGAPTSPSPAPSKATDITVSTTGALGAVQLRTANKWCPSLTLPIFTALKLGHTISVQLIKLGNSPPIQRKFLVFSPAYDFTHWWFLSVWLPAYFIQFARLYSELIIIKVH